MRNSFEKQSVNVADADDTAVVAIANTLLVNGPAANRFPLPTAVISTVESTSTTNTAKSTITEPNTSTTSVVMDTNGVHSIPSINPPCPQLRQTL